MYSILFVFGGRRKAVQILSVSSIALSARKRKLEATLL